MPTISQFYGIKIYIFYNDHAEPHFHAYYAGKEAEISVKTGKLIAGELSIHAAKLIKAWIKLHKKELEENWKLAEEHKKLKTIKPLE